MPLIIEKSLTGQRALVTGGSSGIGAAIAVALAEAGARVAINYLSDAEEAGKLVDQIQASGGEAIAVQADVSQEDQVIAMFQRVIETWGSLDILVNNAGIQLVYLETKASFPGKRDCNGIYRKNPNKTQPF